MISVRLFSSSMIIAVATGCSVNFPQVQTAIDFISAQVERRSSNSDSPDSRWTASYNNAGRIMTPYIRGDITLFLSQEGDAIAFDGWTVRSLGGFGQDEIIRVIDRDGKRVFQNDRKSYVTICESWTKEIFSSGEVTWQQRCGVPKQHTNYLRLDEKGLIIEIDQFTDSEGGRLQLKKM